MVSRAGNRSGQLPRDLLGHGFLIEVEGRVGAHLRGGCLGLGDGGLCLFGRAAGLDIEVEEVLVSESSSMAAKTLERSRIRQDFGVIVLALTKSKGEMKFNPPGDMTLGAGNVLIVMGERSNLKRLETELET